MRKLEKTNKINNMKNFLFGTILSTIALGLIVGFFWGISFGWKNYKVSSYAQDGKANLAQAEWEKKITIETARANNEAASLNAEAQIKIAKAQAETEVVRAKGVAEANAIIGESLKDNDEYLRYLWITNMKEGKDVIYIPTEAGMPILEAGKR